jgi:hypothetical protein
MTDNVYFVRHKMHIPCQDAKELFEQGLIAFHYEDVRSWKLQCYKNKIKGLKTTIRHFNELKKEDGWVVADYSPILCMDKDHNVERKNSHMHRTDKDRNIAKKSDRKTILVGEVEQNSRDYYESRGLSREEAVTTLAYGQLGHVITNIRESVSEEILSSLAQK